jgi:membrane protease YdiL (CAAX protease family)
MSELSTKNTRPQDTAPLFQSKIQLVATGIFLFLYVLIFVVGRSFPLFRQGLVSVAFFQAVVYAVLAVLGVLAFWPYLKEGILSWKKQPVRSLLFLLGAGIAQTLLTNVVAIAVTSWTGIDEFGGDSAPLIALYETYGLVPILLCVGFAGPIVEELVYRLVLTGWASRVLPVWIAVLASSVLFAVMHCQVFDFYWLIRVLPIAATGVVYAVTYCLSRNISIPIILHVFNNASSVILLATIL